MRNTLTLILLLFTAIAHGQPTQPARVQVAADLQPNGVRAITAAKLNQIFTKTLNAIDQVAAGKMDSVSINTANDSLLLWRQGFVFAKVKVGGGPEDVKWIDTTAGITRNGNVFINGDLKVKNDLIRTTFNPQTNAGAVNMYAQFAQSTGPYAGSGEGSLTFSGQNLLYSSGNVTKGNAISFSATQGRYRLDLNGNYTTSKSVRVIYDTAIGVQFSHVYNNKYYYLSLDTNGISLNTNNPKAVFHTNNLDTSSLVDGSLIHKKYFLDHLNARLAGLSGGTIYTGAGIVDVTGNVISLKSGNLQNNLHINGNNKQFSLLNVDGFLWANAGSSVYNFSLAKPFFNIAHDSVINVSAPQTNINGGLAVNANNKPVVISGVNGFVVNTVGAGVSAINASQTDLVLAHDDDVIVQAPEVTINAQQTTIAGAVTMPAYAGANNADSFAAFAPNGTIIKKAAPVGGSMANWNGLIDAQPGAELRHTAGTARVYSDNYYWDGFQIRQAINDSLNFLRANLPTGGGGGSSQWANVSGGISYADKVGIGTNTPTNALHIATSGTGNSQLRIGSMELQSYAVGNSWLGDNVYYSAGFRRRQAGKALLFYFYGSEGQFRSFGNGAAGQATDDHGDNAKLKFDETGRFGIGANIAETPGDFTGSAFFHNGSGNIGINTTTPAYKLDVNGTANVGGFRMATAGSAGYVLTRDADGVATWQAPTGSTGGSSSIDSISGLFDVQNGDGLRTTATSIRNYSDTGIFTGAMVREAIEDSLTHRFLNTPPIAVAGSDGNLQFNAGNFLGASANLHWDNANSRLAVGGKIESNSLKIEATGQSAYLSTGLFYAPQNNVQGNMTQLNFGISNSTKNSTDWRFYYDGNSSDLNRNDFGFSGVVEPVFSYTAAGNVGVGTTTPATKLAVTGAITYNTTAEPATPASGSCVMWFDGTQLKVKKNVNGDISITVIF